MKAYNRHLSNLIASGKAKPSFLVSHQLSLDEAPEAYHHFDNRDSGWTKVVLKPHAIKTQTKRELPDEVRNAESKKGHKAKSAGARG